MTMMMMMMTMILDAPIANQRLLNMEKLLEMDGPSLSSSMCHSNGLNRLTRNSTTLTPSSLRGHEVKVT